MTLSKLLLAAVLSLAATAQAYIVPGDNYGPIGNYPPPQPYNPVMPYPNQPHEPYQPGGQVFSKEAVLNRVYRNDTLQLRRLADIDRNFRGFSVERVHVVVRPGFRPTQTNLQLLVNRNVEDERSIYGDTHVTLYPRSNLEIGEDVNGLQLRVQGEIYIERVIVELRQGNHYQPNPPPYNPGYGQEIVVPLNLPAYMSPGAYLDLTHYVDVRRYRGYQLTAVEITANARYNAALIDVMVNSGRQGTVTLNRYSQTHRVQVYGHVVMGQNFGTLTLLPRGDANLSAVRLILRR